MLAALVGTVLAAGGCANALFTAAWLVKGGNVDPEYAGLKNKKVAVVCRSPGDLAYRDSNVGKDLAREIGKFLKQNVTKIQVVDARKVDDWIDENTWNEYTEVGKAVGADLVVGVDLEEFGLYEGQTVYQGKASVVVKVYDCKTGESVFEKRLPRVVYPPSGVVPTSDKSEADFRRMFVRVLSDQIARHFYPHDPRDYFAIDSTAMH